jgi:hypothetical protein
LIVIRNTSGDLPISSVTGSERRTGEIGPSAVDFVVFEVPLAVGANSHQSVDPSKNPIGRETPVADDHTINRTEP